MNIKGTLEILDEEPILFAGITATELFLSTIGGYLLLLIISISIFGTLGFWMLSFTIPILLNLGFVYFFAKWLGRKKERHPLIWIIMQKQLQKRFNIIINVDLFALNETFSCNKENI